MAFADNETSQSLSAPIELYRVVGTFDTYLMTTNHVDVVTDIGTFLATTIKRSAIENRSTDQSEVSIEITIPFDHPISTDYVFNVSPPDLTVEIFRIHRGAPDDRRLLWKGNVTGFSVEGRELTIQVPSRLAYSLKGVCPRVRYQAPCNHVLYDEYCGVDRNDHNHDTTVTEVDGREIDVTSNPFATNACRGGELVWAAGNQRRLIISNNALRVNINFPFSGLTVGESVEITKGCDHAWSGDCKNKFDNTINFGGHPTVPKVNPFTGSL